MVEIELSRRRRVDGGHSWKKFSLAEDTKDPNGKEQGEEGRGTKAEVVTDRGTKTKRTSFGQPLISVRIFTTTNSRE